MGRMLDMLKNGDASRASSPVDGRNECVVDWSLPESPEIPFIEVGGPKRIDGSAQVLAARHASSTALQPPHVIVDKTLPVTAPAVAPSAAAPSVPVTTAPVTAASSSPARVVEMAHPRPMSVALEAWPAQRKFGRAVAAEIVAYHQPEHAISQQYLVLLDQMTQALRDTRGVVLLSGVRGLVGTTTVLLNLAVACARQRQQRVVVWEANLGRAGLAARLGLEPTVGVTDVLCGAAALEKAVLEGPAPGLFVLPAQGAMTHGSATLCSPEAARWLVSWLRERFDLVLIDGPNLDNTLALGVLAPIADDLYLVAPQSERHLLHPGLAQTVTRLGGRLRGLIHTQFEM